MTNDERMPEVPNDEGRQAVRAPSSGGPSLFGHSTFVTTEQPSAWRAWTFLLAHSWQRLARARLMLWVAVGLLLLFALVVYVNTSLGRYGMAHWRFPRRGGLTFTEHLENTHAAAALLRTDPAVCVFS